MSSSGSQPDGRKRRRDEPEAAMERHRVEASEADGDNNRLSPEAGNGDNNGTRCISMTFNNQRLDADTDPKDVPASMFKMFVGAVRSVDTVQRLWGMTMLKKLLAARKEVNVGCPSVSRVGIAHRRNYFGNSNIFDEVIDAEMIPEVMELLTRYNTDEAIIKVEAVWVLSYVARHILKLAQPDGEDADSNSVQVDGSPRQKFVDQQIRYFQMCVPLLVKCGRSTHMALHAACCVALCNIASATLTASFIKLFLSHGALKFLVEVIDCRPFSSRLGRTVAAVRSFLGEVESNDLLVTSLVHLAPSLPVLRRLIEEHPNDEVVLNACRAVECVSIALDQDFIKGVFLSSELLLTVQDLVCAYLPDVSGKRRSICQTAMRIFANCVRSQLIPYEDGMGGMQVFHSVMEAGDLQVREDVCGVLQTVAMSQNDRWWTWVDPVSVVPLVIETMQSAYRLNQKSKAVWLMTHLAEKFCDGAYSYLVQGLSCLWDMVQFLDSSNPAIVYAALLFILRSCQAGAPNRDTIDVQLQPFFPPLWQLRFNLWIHSLTEHADRRVRNVATNISRDHLPITPLVSSAAQGDVNQVQNLIETSYVSAEERGEALLVASICSQLDVVAHLSDVCVTASCHALYDM